MSYYGQSNPGNPMPPYQPPPQEPRGSGRGNFLSGVLGGLMVAVVGAILLATGVIETGGDEKSPPPAQRTIAAQPSNDVENPDESKTVQQVYEEDGPGVAFIQAQSGGSGLGGESGGTGSGFVLDEKGNILTNAHVVQGASEIQVRLTKDGDLLDAELVGIDPSTDLAVIKVDPKIAKLRPLTLGDSSKVRVGDPVIAIGNPFGYDQTVTTGIVSALQRQIKAPNNFDIDNVIQTDAAINPGNSGGPLLDSNGRVIGVNSQIATGGGTAGSIGIGFAVPINTAKKVIPQLERDGKIDRAYLGITSAQISKDIAQELKLPTDKGALVQEVVSGGPADRAGIRGGAAGVPGDITPGGDLIVSIDGRAIEKPADVASVLEGRKPGNKVQVRLIRGGKEKVVVVTLGKRPQEVPGDDPGGSTPGLP